MTEIYDMEFDSPSGASVKKGCSSAALAATVRLPSTPRCGAMSVRPATSADLTFIDRLQKMHTHMVGFFPLKQFEKHIEEGNVLIAQGAVAGAGEQALGYCLSKDQYMKRDDVGIVYQLNVLPLKQRGLIGASLIKAVFERAAYGCRLFSCWCAQDIQANWFWESIGFVPLAFRTGSRSKQRIHIYWQRRVREQDEYPYWFPAKTEGGAVMEDRIVLPIPPGTHWRDAKPLVLPGIETKPAEPEMPKTLPGGAPVKPRPEQGPKPTVPQRMQIARSASKHLQGCPPGKTAILSGGKLKYIDHPEYMPEAAELEAMLNPPKERVARKPRAPRLKHDVKLIAAARELRDRYLDEVNSGRFLPEANGKYDVSRQLPSGSSPMELTPAPMLDAA